MGPTCTAAGVALLALTTWWRAIPSPGSTRWWTGANNNAHAVLIGLPGIALVLIAAWPASTYRAHTAALTGEAWKLWFALPLAIGLVMCLWAGLQLPIPSWVKPRWLREQDRRRADPNPAVPRRGRRR